MQKAEAAFDCTGPLAIANSSPWHAVFSAGKGVGKTPVQAMPTAVGPNGQAGPAAPRGDLSGPPQIKGPRRYSEDVASGQPVSPPPPG